MCVFLHVRVCGVKHAAQAAVSDRMTQVTGLMFEIT